jgi:soluble lytic murein transglycosylase-like protein
MPLVKIIFILSFLGIFLQPEFTASAEGMDLSHYVRKYRQVEISSEQLDKLSPYNDLIEHFSSIAFFRPRHKVDPDFIRALILAESGADPQALSNKNAMGLSQILFETGKLAAREIHAKELDYMYVSRQKLARLKPEDLYDPAINILLACYLIAKYNNKFEGKLDLVVSAWNAGENSINDNRPPQYDETLNLIGKVNGFFVCLLRE